MWFRRGPYKSLYLKASFAWTPVVALLLAIEWRFGLIAALPCALAALVVRMTIARSSRAPWRQEPPDSEGPMGVPAVVTGPPRSGSGYA